MDYKNTLKNIFKNKKFMTYLIIFIIIYVLLSVFKSPLIIIISIFATYYICFQSSYNTLITDKISSMV